MNVQKIALKLQLFHLSLSVIWNVTSVILVTIGLQELGPTSSLLWALVLIVAAMLIWLAAQRFIILYAVLSILQLIAASSTIYNAFIKDPSLWPSEFWRFSGMFINTLGIIGSLSALGLLLVMFISRRH